MLTDNINKYYSKNKEEFDKLVGKANYKTKIYRDDDDNNTIDVLDNDKTLLRATYEVIGYYNTVTSIWVWGWANPFVEKDMTNKVREMKELEQMFITTDKLDDKTKQLYLYFIKNPSFYIASENLDNLLSMILYYTNGKWTIPRNYGPANSPNYLEFILIKNILQIK